MKEPDWELMMKKKKKAYLPPRFMTAAEAAKQILQIIKSREGIARLLLSGQTTIPHGY